MSNPIVPLITITPSSPQPTTTTTTRTTVGRKRAVLDNTNQSNKRPRTRSTSSLRNNDISVISPTNAHGYTQSIPTRSGNSKTLQPPEKVKTRTNGRRNGGHAPAAKNSKAASSAFSRAIPPTAPSSTQNSTLGGRTVEEMLTEQRLPLAFQPVDENGYSYCETELVIGQICYDQGKYLEAAKHFNHIPKDNPLHNEVREIFKKPRGSVPNLNQ